MEDTRVDMMQLYKWDLCEKMIESGYGVIPYLEFLKKEKERFEMGDGRVATIKVVHKTRCALFVNRIAEDIEDDE